MKLKVLEKSRKLLVQVMGQEDFDKFVENEKIEIKHGEGKNEIIYELDQDARVFNKTKSQSYCIEPIVSDNLPLHDQLAIKYSYLKNNIKKVEEVANKRNTGQYEVRSPVNFDAETRRRQYGAMTGQLHLRFADTSENELGLTGRIRQGPSYDDYVIYLESRDWRRSQITLDEYNVRLLTVNSVNRNCTGQVIDIRCPAGQKISIMGTQQVPIGADARIAHTLRARFADEQENEIPYNTHVQIIKEKPSGETIQLARLFYSDINLTLKHQSCPSDILTYKTDDQWYRFRQGIELNGEEHLILSVENRESDIAARCCRLAIDCDLWVM